MRAINVMDEIIAEWESKRSTIPAQEYSCDICKDRGFTVRIDKQGYQYVNDCECVLRQRQLEIQQRLIRESGLEDKFKKCTLDTFQTNESWQRSIFNAAKGYGQNAKRGWLVFCGQSGCGKTHAAAAACGELIKRGYSLRYMGWRDLGAKIKRNANDDAKYTELIQPLKDCDVLYIDDLFKGGKNSKGEYSDADINLVFELLNYRYDRDKMIIISTELSIPQIGAIDESIAGRIAEMAEGMIITITKDSRRNMRVSQS